MPFRLAALLTLAALSAPAGAPRADDPAAAPPAQETLRRAREAQGGEAWDRVQGLRLVEAVELGGSAEEGLALLGQAVRRSPGDPGPLTLLGAGLSQAGRAGDACAAWRAALALQDDPLERERLAGRLAGASCPR